VLSHAFCGCILLQKSSKLIQQGCSKTSRKTQNPSVVSENWKERCWGEVQGTWEGSMIQQTHMAVVMAIIEKVCPGNGWKVLEEVIIISLHFVSMF
jgi:hypothetical protein